MAYPRRQYLGGHAPRVPKRWTRHLRRGLTAWLAVELGAAVLAAALVVALGPLVVVLLVDPRSPWLAIGGVLVLSVPVAALLGKNALSLSVELLAQARSL